MLPGVHLECGGAHFLFKDAPDIFILQQEQSAVSGRFCGGCASIFHRRKLSLFVSAPGIVSGSWFRTTYFYDFRGALLRVIEHRFILVSRVLPEPLLACWRSITLVFTPISITIVIDIIVVLWSVPQLFGWRVPISLVLVFPSTTVVLFLPPIPLRCLFLVVPWLRPIFGLIFTPIGSFGLRNYFFILVTAPIPALAFCHVFSLTQRRGKFYARPRSSTAGTHLAASRNRIL